MYKNKRKGLTLLMTLFLFAGMMGCGGKKIMSDAGTDISNEIETEQYLDTQVLSEESKKKTTYKTHVLEYGTYEEPVVESMLEWSPYSTRPVKAKVEEGTMTYVGSEILGNYLFVNKGDVVASVEMEVDEADITAEKLKLQRLQERYERDREEFLEQREKNIEENDRVPDKYDYEAGRILLERDVLEWENNAWNYEQRISEVSKRVDELEKLQNTTGICSTKSGILFPLRDTPQSGDEIKDGQIIANLVPSDVFMLGQKNDNGTYAYGMEFNFKVINYGNNTEVLELPGKVVNGTQADLYGNLDNSFAHFLVDTGEGVSEDLNIYIGGARITGSVNKMEHVLLVPKEAVTEEGKVTYVTVINPDGSFIKTGFKAGGSNSDYYWVLSGLDEGTEILLGQ